MKKRSFLQATLLLGSGSLPTAQAQTAGPTAPTTTPIKFQLDWRFEGPAAFFLNPMAKGYFKAVGLDSPPSSRRS